MTPDLIADRILGLASFAGDKLDGQGCYVETWCLTRPIPGHPKGSTVSRATLVAHIRGFGSQQAKLEEFAALRRVLE